MRNKMADICEASSGERFFVTYRFIDKIRQVIFVLKKELYLVSPTEKLKNNFCACVKTNWLLKTRRSFSLDERFIISTLRMWTSSLAYTFRRALLEETLSSGEVSEADESHWQIEFICFSPSLRRKTGITSRLSLSLSFTSYPVRFAW